MRHKKNKRRLKSPFCTLTRLRDNKKENARTETRKRKQTRDKRAQQPKRQEARGETNKKS